MTYDLHAKIAAGRQRRLAEIKGMSNAGLAAKAAALLDALDPRTASAVGAAWQKFAAIDYRHANLTKQGYLAHPLRVAESYVETVPGFTAEGVILALGHNLVETGGDASEALLRSLDRDVPGIQQWVHVLTIDRRRQGDADYLAQYYAAIGEAGAPVNQIKVLDKMDNLHLLCTNPDDAVRNSYLQEIETHVFPLARSCIPQNEAYLCALVEVARELGHVPAV